MADNIVDGLFGISPWQAQQQQRAAIDAMALQRAQLDPFQRASMGMYQGGAQLGKIAGGMLGMEDPAVAEAKARETAISGLDTSNPEAILQRAAQVQDPRLKMRLTQLAQQLKEQQQKAIADQQKAALDVRKQDFAENQAFELKKQEAEARIRQNDERIRDARTTAEERAAIARESNELKKLLGMMMIEQRKAANDAKRSGKSALSATAQKELFEADEAVIGAKAGSKALDDAISINKEAMGFKGAGIIADVGSILPDVIRPKTFDTTLELDNIVQQSVLPQLKSIFGANPTEGERKILLEVAGSSSKPAPVRKGIFERAKRAADARAKFNEEKASKLRAGTYFGGAQLEEPTVTESVQQPVASGGWSIRKK